MKLHELAYFTDNVQGMTDFYCGLLGMDPVAKSDDMAIFMSGGTKIFIHRNYPPAEGDLPANNHIAFAVEDVDATCAALTEQGLTLEVSPKDYYWGRFAYLRDPDGHQVEFIKGPESAK
jgi:catechol 2,3-dioxygenase-like lactoylglutathione lyase family enzyme